MFQARLRIGGLVVSALVLLGWAAAPTLLGSELSYFPLNGSLDDTISGNHGTYRAGGSGATGGTPTFVDGFDGTENGAMAFNAATLEMIDVAHTVGLPLTQYEGFSVAMWVKGLPQNDRRVFSESSSSSAAPLYNIGTERTGASGVLHMYIRGDNNSAPVDHKGSSLQPFDDAWHHIVVVDDNGVLTYYVDGVRDGQQTTYARPVLTAGITTIGAILRPSNSTPASNGFTGAIDDVRLFDHALTTAEVEAIATIPSECPEVSDVTCEGVELSGPPGGAPGVYTTTVTATDASGDALYYTVLAENAATGASFYAGPQTSNQVTMVLLDEGEWTIEARAFDNLRCRNTAAECSTTVTVSDPDRLVAHLPIAGSLEDVTGSGNDGAFAGYWYPQFATGSDCSYQGALTFDGANDYVALSRGDGLPLYLRNAYSVAMWVKGPLQSDKRIFSEGSTATNTPLINIGTDNTGATGSVDIFIRGMSGTPLNHVKSTAVAFDDTWHHIAWVDDGGNAVLYVDGVLDATDFTYAKPVVPELDTTSIGGILRAGPCCYFTGEIDDVRLYSYAITADEVAALVTEVPECPEIQLIGGDCNQDGARDVSDVVCYIIHQFPSFVLIGTGSLLPCQGDAASVGNLASLDVNGDRKIDISDPVFLAMYIFMGGQPPAQGPACFGVPESVGCPSSIVCTAP